MRNFSHHHLVLALVLCSRTVQFQMDQQALRPNNRLMRSWPTSIRGAIRRCACGTDGGPIDGRGGAARRTALGWACGGQASSCPIAQHLFPVVEPAEAILDKRPVPDLKLSCSLFPHFVQSRKVHHYGTRTRRVYKLGFKPTAKAVLCPRNIPKASCESFSAP